MAFRRVKKCYKMYLLAMHIHVHEIKLLCKKCKNVYTAMCILKAAVKVVIFLY